MSNSLGESNIVLPRLPLKKLKNHGRWIVDDDGRIFMFRGVNMINKEPPYTLSHIGFDENDAELLAKNGINVVRVGVIYSAVEPAPGTYDDKYLDDIRKTVDTLALKGIMSLIDFHQDGWGPSFICEGFPEWATLTGGHPIRPIGNFPELYTNKAVGTAFDNFWANAPGPGNIGLQDRYASAWQLAASKLKDSPGILGWELMNEPNPGTHIFKPPTAQLTAFTQKMVNAIRQVDVDHIIWYEPWVSFDVGVPTDIGPISDPGPVRRIGMAFHNYEPIDKYDVVWKNAINHSNATGDALLATEFGAQDTAPPIVQEMNSIDQWMMPAIYWAYSNRTPYQIAKLDGQPVSSIKQGLVYDPALPLEPPNLWVDKFDALVRPYPMVIAGIPVGWSFDPTSKVFNFKYTQGAASYTEIFVPLRQYTNGYKVSVVGGTEVHYDQRVVVEANAGTTQVTITPL